MKTLLAFVLGFLCGACTVIAIAVLDRDGDGAGTARTNTIGSAPPTSARSVPNVVGMVLPKARDALEGRWSVEVQGGGLFGVVVENNWRVVSQDPPQGTQLARGEIVRVAVERR